MKAEIRRGVRPQKKSTVSFDGVPSLTKQSFEAECNINNIMARYQKTGIIDHVSRFGAQYGFATGETYHEQMLQVAKAQTMFEELPSSIRKRFDNNPAEFLDYVHGLEDDPQRVQKLIEAGLASPQAIAMAQAQSASEGVTEPSKPPKEAQKTPASE